jgi:hypothetical protein
LYFDITSDEAGRSEEGETDLGYRACLRRLILFTQQFYAGEDAHKETLHNVVKIPYNIIDDVYNDPEDKKRVHKPRRGRRQVKKAKLEEEGTATTKTPVTLLHEYCFNVLKITPEYRMTIQGDLFVPTY